MWGRCGGEDVTIDADSAVVRHFPGAIVGPDPFSLPIQRCLFERDWLEGVLTEEVRRSGVGAGCGRGGVMSEAVAVAELVKKWWTNTEDSRDPSSRWCQRKHSEES